MLDWLVGVEELTVLTRDELTNMIKLTRNLALEKLDNPETAGPEEEVCYS